eukprot:CAMPEP_0174911820 /NCGR_PEP_ID=MMETSP0167-20121228/78344_1 /TAXON_ID=38298 /ORGANISM="Rhodella maculata, Strain CCMP736" /LENGTH=58 /DNA_ID=CAMNT_0016156407 /DNA_START=21 /DNA_END=194 /DNA_ORIENTATION=+
MGTVSLKTPHKSNPNVSNKAFELPLNPSSSNSPSAPSTVPASDFISSNATSSSNFDSD